VPNIIEIGQHW